MSFDLRDDSRDSEFIPQSAALVALNLKPYTNSARKEKIVFISKTLEYNLRQSQHHLKVAILKSDIIPTTTTSSQILSSSQNMIVLPRTKLKSRCS
jgi:hypothetical protein